MREWWYRLVVCWVGIGALLTIQQTAWAGVDLEAYAEIPLNQGINIPLDQGNGPGHGIIYLQYTNQTHVGTGNQLRLGLNTDTVWAAWDIGATSGQAFVFTPYIKGQFGFGEMTPDYIKEGTFIEEMSFFSFYGEAGLEGRYHLASSYRIEASLAFRYWWFAHRGPSEVSGFVLPQNSPALQGSLRFVGDTMNRRLMGGRLHEGMYLAITGQLRHRFTNQSWGGAQTPFGDRRNQSISPFPTVQLLAHAEWAQRLHSTIVLSIKFEGGTGWFADDLHRFKVGGDNTYIPMISGTNFAEFVVDSYALAHLTMVFLPIKWLRITPQVDVGFLPNPTRANPNTPEANTTGVVVGLGLAFDFFLQDYMRIHVKAGFAPNVTRLQQQGGWKVFAGYAASWW